MVLSERLQRYWRIIKLLIGCILVLTISYQIFFKLNGKIQLDELLSLQYDLKLLLLVFLLVPLNWILEAAKWRVLLLDFFHVSFQKCIKGVLSGLSVAVFTPNRIGDVGGRILHFPSHQRKIALWTTLVANLSQFVILVLFGLAGAIYFIDDIWIKINVNDYFLFLTFCLLLVTFTGIFFIHPIARILVSLVPIEAWKKKLIPFIEPLQIIRSKNILIAIGFSALRYACYTVQFFLTLRFFNVKMPLDETMHSISLVYLLKTTIPYPPFVGFVVRTEISIFVFQYVTESLMGVIAASILIWIINVAIPALIGYGFILHIRNLKIGK
jgi:hypothetical protein